MKKIEELRTEYDELIHNGKKQEALVIRNLIWTYKEVKTTETPKRVEEVETKKSDIVESKISKLSDLTSINGIGKKVLKDIKNQFSSLEELKDGLSKDKVSLRDDIVEKLKLELFN